MTASRYVRTAGALGHLLLVVVLALGIFAMHSTGHPEEPSGSAMSTASHTSTMDAAAAADDLMGAPASMAPGHSADSPSAHQPAMSMDMASLCMAVLFGAWAITALLKSAFARHREWLARLLAQVTVAMRPHPPPRGPDLTQLSVLRL
ncbi:DUF6153 family protein [Streptomyces sp. NPDC086554]|uniref:DUF6153 family protein n=1 Tax=Streptomyces sp. NPDC086554 TaxID=3154864 RepID=UPI0034345F95